MKKWQAIAIIIFILILVFGFGIYDLWHFKTKGGSFINPVLNIFFMLFFASWAVYEFRRLN